jgi:hypothetical protein
MHYCFAQEDLQLEFQIAVYGLSIESMAGMCRDSCFLWRCR